MRSNEEIYKSLLFRYNDYQEKRKRRINAIKKAASFAACFAVIFSGYMIYENVSKMPDKSLMIENTTETFTETTAETTSFVNTKEAFQSDERFTHTALPSHTSQTDAPVCVTKPTVTETSLQQTTAAETQTVLTTTIAKTETSQSLPLTETVRTTSTTAIGTEMTTTILTIGDFSAEDDPIPWDERTIFRKYDEAKLENGTVYYLRMECISGRVSAEYYGMVNLFFDEYIEHDYDNGYDIINHNEYVSAYIINGYSPEDCIAVWDDVNGYYGVFVNFESKKIYKIMDELEEYRTYRQGGLNQ